MNADLLDTHLVAYLSLREALGFQMQAETRLLPEFVAYVHAQPNPRPIRALMALNGPAKPPRHRGPSGAARRLSMARGFLRYLQASVPDTEVPAPRAAPHPTTTATLPVHSRSDHRTCGRRARESPTWGLASPYLILFAGLAGQHRSAGRRSHPFTDRSGQTGSRSAAITHPGNEVP